MDISDRDKLYAAMYSGASIPSGLSWMKGILFASLLASAIAAGVLLWAWFTDWGQVSIGDLGTWMFQRVGKTDPALMAPGYDAAKFASIKEGDSAQHVLHVLGAPLDKSYHIRDTVIWEYYYRGKATRYRNTVFTDARVFLDANQQYVLYTVHRVEAHVDH